ncbi:hypothetical protein EVAR_88296_1 [Eumeta japonica]|uniref:Uncharacterized protein n=1 Tax=Eumeta variegata TaxID=151549 RepID=A0A4C1VLB2_EUMVA|nr:hypothetical protein EVAR_88296_1 [Eumeta japonica]
METFVKRIYLPVAADRSLFKKVDAIRLQRTLCKRYYRALAINKNQAAYAKSRIHLRGSVRMFDKGPVDKDDLPLYKFK